MRASEFFLNTLKENPSDAELVSQRLMIRAGLINKLGSGLFTWMPLGYRILQKVETIVREEMNRIGALQIVMPNVQPAELWQETGRWQDYGNELLKIMDRHERAFVFAPTHEEVITNIARNELRSYKQLPVCFYQIHTKFRDEIRPRFGVMRAREFLMKDAYSFHIDHASLRETYQKMYGAYTKIFTRLGLDFRAVEADTGSIGGSVSHEFQVIADAGEDILMFSDSSDYAANIELAALPNVKDGDPSPDGKGKLVIKRGIEVGHIFQLGDKYSKAMNATVIDEHGKHITMQMGCYGIGVSRVVAATIEQHHDEHGIVWPEAMAPFQIALIPINYHKSQRIREATNKLYNELQTVGYEVFLDDRNERAGVLFADMDLIGIPHRLVLGERGLDQGKIEYKARTSQEVDIIELTELLNFLQRNLLS